MARRPRPFNNPFADQGKALKRKLAEETEAKKAAPPKPPPDPEPPPADDKSLFHSAMTGAVPLDDPRGVTAKPVPPGHAKHVPIYDEDAETLAELASLVDGTGHFDISDSDEFIEGCAEGLDRRLLRRLKRGDFAVRAHLDLHGMTREPAQAAVVAFLHKARTDGSRCVLIVHGRGLNSKDQIPILKGLLKRWLERGRLAKHILAFCTAQPHDGGSGAVYVLLRR